MIDGSDPPPKMSPWNLGFRFLLELGALGAMGVWGYQQRDDASRWGLAIGVPVFAVSLWTIFATPDDPSRGGQGLVPIPGWLRLGFEIAFFAFATYTLADRTSLPVGLTYGAATAGHYAISYERLAWLFRH